MPHLAKMQMPPLPAAVAVAIFYRQVLEVGLVLAATLVALVVVLVIAGRLRSPLSRPASSVRSPSVRPERAWLAAGLGSLWVLDGLLQLQPLMVTRFLSGVVAPLIGGEPGWLAAAMRFGVQLWGVDPISWNVLAAYLQVAVGLAILFGGEGRLRRAGLWLSIVWSLIVWVPGEAMGGVFVGGGWLSGAPGSVLFYLLSAGFLLLPAEVWNRGAWRRWFALGMGLLWLFDAGLQAWPAAGFWDPRTLSDFATSMGQMPQPAALAAPLLAWARALQSAPVVWNAGLVAVMAGLGAGWLLRPDSRLLWAATALWTLATWYFGQDFGVLGGMGTDPNSGAIVTLLLAVYARAAVAVHSVAPVPRPDGAPAGAEEGALN